MNVFKISTDFGMPTRADLHECGHNGDETTRGQEPVSECLGWHIGHYAYLMAWLPIRKPNLRATVSRCALVRWCAGALVPRCGDCALGLASRAGRRLALCGFRRGSRSRPAGVLLAPGMGTTVVGDCARTDVVDTSRGARDVFS